MQAGGVVLGNGGAVLVVDALPLTCINRPRMSVGIERRARRARRIARRRAQARIDQIFTVRAWLAGLVRRRNAVGRRRRRRWLGESRGRGESNGGNCDKSDRAFHGVKAPWSGPARTRY